MKYPFMKKARKAGEALLLMLLPVNQLANKLSIKTIDKLTKELTNLQRVNEAARMVKLH